MSSFTTMMLEEGVEVRIPSDLSGIIKILDSEVPHYSFEGYGYTLAGGKATLGKRWDLMIKSIKHSDQELPPFPVGRIELEKLDEEFVNFRIPPRGEQDVPGTIESDPSGKIFSSFIFHTLNMLHRNKLIELLGVLPVG